MNKRIRKLAEQARAEEYSGWLGGKPATTVTLDELERFAQLIVKECMEQVIGQYLPVMEDKEMMKDTRWDGYVQCGVDSVVAIRKHFGVEQ